MFHASELLTSARPSGGPWWLGPANDVLADEEHQYNNSQSDRRNRHYCLQAPLPAQTNITTVQTPSTSGRFEQFRRMVWSKKTPWPTSVNTAFNQSGNLGAADMQTYSLSAIPS
jgi:hypothetical protein